MVPVLTSTEVKAFAELFRGRTDACGRGKLGVRRGEVTNYDYELHLSGRGDPLGVFPLLNDGTVYWACVDLDEPNRPMAELIAELIPGPAYVEQSPSGNFHIWVFFDGPLAARFARGILKHVTEAAGCPRAEVFPKQAELRAGMLGNYLQIPYFGARTTVSGWALDKFLALVERAQAWQWEARATRMGLGQAQSSDREQGTSPTLHCCAEHILRNAETNPVVEGHRHVVMFNLAKMLLDYREFDEDEAWYFFQQVNNASPDALSDFVLRRTFDNALAGGFTSYGCDDPIMAPYVDPNCPIAFPKGSK